VAFAGGNLPNGAVVDHLSTQHLRAGMKFRTLSGALASAGSQGGQLLLTLGYTAILARLLTPHDFGLVAMALVVAGFLHVFKDAGLSTATIQREGITNAQVSNLFWINVAAGAAAMLVMASSAPLVASFFRQPELVAVSVVLSAGFVLEALAVQHVAILNRQMRFPLVSGLDLGCTAAGFLVGVLMALTGWGYWALVGTTLATPALRTAGVWAISGWRPQRPVAQSGTRPLVRFGADLTLVGVVYAVTRSFDSVLIGRFIGSDAVGLYSRATALLTRPLERLISPIHTVAVPALSRLQEQPERYRRAFVRMFEGLAIGAFLLAGLSFPLADVLVRVILGDRWEAAGPIFAALTLAFIYVPLSNATAWLFMSQGRGRDLLVSACAGGAIMVAAFIIGLPFGASGVAVAYSTASLVVTLPVTFYMAGRSGPVATSDLWAAAASHVPVFLAVLAATWLAREALVPTGGPVMQLVVGLSVGSAAGLATAWTFARSRRALRDILAEVNEFRRNAVGAATAAESP
jgi:O-antigen/teichoic acid export membrane protein